jgi:hypothetical protein
MNRLLTERREQALPRVSEALDYQRRAFRQAARPADRRLLKCRVCATSLVFHDQSTSGDEQWPDTQGVGAFNPLSPANRIQGVPKGAPFVFPQNVPAATHNPSLRRPPRREPPSGKPVSTPFALRSPHVETGRITIGR